MTSNAPSNDIQVVASQVVLSNPTRGPLFYGTLLFASRRTLPGEDCDAEPPVLCALEDITNEKFLDGRGPTTMSLYGVVVAHSIREDGSAGEVLSYSYYGPRDSLDYWHNILVRPNDPVGVLFLWEKPAAGSWKLFEDPHSPKLPLIFVYSGDIAAQYGADIKTFIALLSPDEQAKYKTILARSNIHYHFVRVGGMDRIHIVRHETVPHRAAVLNRRNVHFGMDNFLQTRIFIDHCSGLYESDGDTLKEVSKHSMYASYAKSYANKMTVGGLSASAIYNLQRELLHLVWRRDDPATSLGEAEEMDTESGETIDAFLGRISGYDTDFAACLTVYAHLPGDVRSEIVGADALATGFNALGGADKTRLSTVLTTDGELLARICRFPNDAFIELSKSDGDRFGLSLDERSSFLTFLYRFGSCLPVTVPDTALVTFHSRREVLHTRLLSSAPLINSKTLFDGDVPKILTEALSSCSGPLGGIWHVLREKVPMHLPLDDLLGQLVLSADQFSALSEDDLNGYDLDSVDTIALRRLWVIVQTEKIDVGGIDVNDIFWKLATEDGTDAQLKTFQAGHNSRKGKPREQCCFALLKTASVRIPAVDGTYSLQALRALETCVRFALGIDSITFAGGYGCIAHFATTSTDAFDIVAAMIKNGLGSAKDVWFVPLGECDKPVIERVLWGFAKANTLNLEGSIVDTGTGMVNVQQGSDYTELCDAMCCLALRSADVLPVYALGVFSYAVRHELLLQSKMIDDDDAAIVGSGYVMSVLGPVLSTTTSMAIDEQNLVYCLWFAVDDARGGDVVQTIACQLPVADRTIADWIPLVSAFVGTDLSIRQFFKIPHAIDYIATRFAFAARMRVENILKLPNDYAEDVLFSICELDDVHAPFGVVFESGLVVRHALQKVNTVMKLDAFWDVAVNLLTDTPVFSSLDFALFVGLDSQSCPTAPIDGIDDLAAVLKSIVAFLPTDLLTSHDLPASLHGRAGVLKFVQGWARTLLVDSLLSDNTTRCVSYLDVVTAADSLFDAENVKTLDRVFGFTATKPFQADSKTCELVSVNCETLRTDDGKARASKVCATCVSSLEALRKTFDADTTVLAARVSSIVLGEDDIRIIGLVDVRDEDRDKQWAADVATVGEDTMRRALLLSIKLNDVNGILKCRQKASTKIQTAISTFLGSPTSESSHAVFETYRDVITMGNFSEQSHEGLDAFATTLAKSTVQAANKLQKGIDNGGSFSGSEDGLDLKDAQSSPVSSRSASPTPNTQQVPVSIPDPAVVTLRNRRSLVIATGQWNNNPYYVDTTRTLHVSDTLLLPILCGTLDSDSDPVYAGATDQNNFGALFSYGLSHSTENYLVDPFLVVPNTLKSVGLRFTLHDADGRKYTSLAGHTFQDIFNALYGKPELYAGIGIGVHVVMARAIMTALSCSLCGVATVNLPESLVEAYISACCPKGSLLGGILRAPIDLSGEPCKILNSMNVQTADGDDSFMYQRYRKACLVVDSEFRFVDLLAWFAYATVAEFLMVTGVDDYNNPVRRQSWIPSIDGLVFWSADRTAGNGACPVKLVDSLASALGREYGALLGALRGHCASTQSLLRFVVDTGKFRKKSAFYCRLVVTVGADDALYYTTPGSPNWQTCGRERCTVSAVVPYWATAFDVPPELSIVIDALDIPSRLLQRLYFGAILDGYAAIDVPPWILRTVNGDVVSFVVSGTSIELASSGKLAIRPLQLYKKGYTPKPAGVQEKIGFCAHPVLVWDFNDSKNPFVFAFYLRYVDGVDEIYSCENGLGRSVRMVTSTATKKLTGLNPRSVKAIINGGWSFDITS